MCGVEQESHGCVRRAAIGMLLCKSNELVCNAAERIELERMFSWSGLEKLIEALLQVDGRGSCHVIKVITLAVPGERRSHRGAVTRVEEIIGTGKVLGLSESCGRVAKIRSVVIEKSSAILSYGATGERNSHCRHRLRCGRLNADQASSPFCQRVGKRSAGGGLCRNHLFPHWTSLDVKQRNPFFPECLGIEESMGFEKFFA